MQRTLTHLTVAALLSSSLASASAAEPVKNIRVILPAQSGTVAENIGKVFVRQVQQRCEAKVMMDGDAPFTVELAIAPGSGAEGFRIEDRPGGGVRIVGNDERGLLYGVGKFLRVRRRQVPPYQPLRPGRVHAEHLAGNLRAAQAGARHLLCHAFLQLLPRRTH